MYIDDYVINNKVNLFINNYENLKEIKTPFGIGMMQYSIALSQAMKNKTINSYIIE